MQFSDIFNVDEKNHAAFKAHYSLWCRKCDICILFKMKRQSEILKRWLTTQFTLFLQGHHNTLEGGGGNAILLMAVALSQPAMQISSYYHYSFL